MLSVTHAGGIPGDPAAVEAAADTLRSAAADFTDTADDIGSHRRALSAEWIGTASDAASDHLDRLATRTRAGHDVTAGAANVLTQYAATLRTAQNAYAAANEAAASAATSQASARSALAAAQNAGQTTSVISLQLGAQTGIPTGIAAPDAAALTAASSALTAADTAALEAADAASDAVALAAAADAQAAAAIDALSTQLAEMGGENTHAHGDAHHHEHHEDQHWYSRAWHAVEHFWEGPLKNGEAALGEVAWQSGPGAVAGLAHHSPFADDRAYADDIDHAHDWLQREWGTDTDSRTFTYVADAANVVGLITTDGESGLGAAAREAGATRKAAREAHAGRIGEAAEGGAALTAAQRARVAALPARYRSLDVLTEQAGQKGAWNKALYKPEANKVYLVDDRHTFVTDAKGRVEHVQSDLTYRDPTSVEAHRHGGQQTAAGGADRLEFDQGGHLVAASLGGPGEGINLVAMHKELNGAANEATWGAMEKQLRTLLKEDPSADIKFRVDIEYDGSSARPERLYVEYSTNGARSEIARFVNEH